MADVLDLDNSEEFEDTERQVIARDGDQDMDDEGLWKSIFVTQFDEILLNWFIFDDFWN